MGFHEAKIGEIVLVYGHPLCIVQICIFRGRKC